MQACHAWCLLGPCLNCITSHLRWKNISTKKGNSEQQHGHSEVNTPSRCSTCSQFVASSWSYIHAKSQMSICIIWDQNRRQVDRRSHSGSEASFLQESWKPSINWQCMCAWNWPGLYPFYYVWPLLQSLTSLEKGCSIIITKLKPPRVSIFKKFPKIATGAHVLFNMGHWAQKPSATEEKSYLRNTSIEHRPWSELQPFEIQSPHAWNRISSQAATVVCKHLRNPFRNVHPSFQQLDLDFNN